MIFAPSSCGFQFPSVRPYLKYADISNVCFLSSLSLTSLPQAWSKMFRDGHVSNVRLASLIADTLHGNEIPFNVPAFPCISHINCIYPDDFLTFLPSFLVFSFQVSRSLPPSYSYSRTLGRWTQYKDCLRTGYRDWRNLGMDHVLCSLRVLVYRNSAHRFIFL